MTTTSRATEDRSRRIASVAGIAMVLLLLCVIVVFERSVVVPNVVGEDLGTASAILGEDGIHVDIDGRAGIVTEQSPLPGERWFVWQDVTLSYVADDGSFGWVSGG